MTYFDGGILGAYPVHTSGSASARFNLVVMAEGYRFDQMGQFVVHAQQFAERFLSTPPLDRLRCHVNVYRLDVWSWESGCADPNVPGKCKGTGYDPATFFDSTYCGYDIERLILINQPLVEWARITYTPWAHEVVVLVNADKNGGNGDTYATVAIGDGWDWPKVAIHELGHAAWGLGDEYDFLTSCDDGNTNYPGPEPAWPNVAQDIGRDTIKWGDLVKVSTPLPTQSNPDCTKCNKSSSGGPDDIVGAFEGAALYHCGVYRGQEECIMRYADDFCAVCSASIEEDMALFEPACLAPVFDGTSGWICWLMQFFLSLGIAWLSIFTWHPAFRCAHRRLVFRLQYCEEGNDNECIDLGGGFSFQPVPIAASYPKVAGQPHEQGSEQNRPAR